MFKPLLIVMSCTILYGCASHTHPEYRDWQKFTYDAAERYIEEKAGTSRPDNVKLYKTYIENVTKKDTGYGSRFACTKSKILKKKYKITLKHEQGNRITGHWYYSDECGTFKNAEISGRYNETDLYYYRRNGIGSSFIYRYKIEQDGYRLRDAQYFGLDKGKIKSANVLQNGDKYLMNNYHYTTNFLADEDSDISFTPDRSIDNEVPLSSKLHELIELMKKELITQEEYERKRKQLINSY